MAAQTLQHSPSESYKFQHSSPLETLVRKTSSRRAQGPPKPLGQRSSAQFLHDQYLLSPAYASHNHQMPPNSPLLHTHFRGSTVSAVTNDRSSFLDTTMASSLGDISQELEYAYRDDDASIYSTPSMLPSPRPQDQWGPYDSHLDHEQTPESWDDAYTGTTTHSGFAPQEVDDTCSEFVFQGDPEPSLPTVMISPVVDPGPSSPALQPTRGGKVPIAAPVKFNFSRPGRPPILPSADLKRQVIERNVGRYPADFSSPLPITLQQNPVVTSLPQGMTPGLLPSSSSNGTMKLPPQGPAQPSLHNSPNSPSDIKRSGNMSPYGPPPSAAPISHNPHLKVSPQSPVSTSNSRGPGLPRNLLPNGPSPAAMPNQPPPSPQQYSRPPGPVLLDDHPSVSTSQSVAPSGLAQLLGTDTPLRTTQRFPLPQESPRSMDAFTPQSSFLPDSSIPPTPSSANYTGSSPRDSLCGSLRDMDFYDEPSSSEHSSHPEHKQFSHWSVDGASILELPPHIVDGDTALTSPSWSTKWGSKRNKLRKVKRDGYGYESDGHVSDGSKKKKGKQKTKEIVILWPEPPQQDSYSQGPGQLGDGPSDGTSRDIMPMPALSPIADSPAQGLSPSGGVILSDHSVNVRSPPSPSFSSPSTRTQEDHHPPGPISLDDGTSPAVARSSHPYHAFQPHPRGTPLPLPSPSLSAPPPQRPSEAISLDSPPSGGLARKGPNVVGAHRPPPISLDDPQNTGPPRSTHVQGPEPASSLPDLPTGLQQIHQSSGPISQKDSPWAGGSTNSYELPPSWPQHPEVPIDDSPGTIPSWTTNSYNQYSASPMTRSPNPNVHGSPLPDYSNYPPASPEALPRISTDTVTGDRRPTVELPRAPPPRAVSPATSVYSQYSFYQLDSARASPTGSSTRDSPDSHSSNSWPQEEPRPPLLSPHYTPPTRSPAAELRSPSPAYTISPTHTSSSRSSLEYLQLGIQHHEANRLKDAAICFEKSAEDNGGCGVGMVMWGLTLRHGWGCEKNETLGFKWLQRAAESAVTDLESSRKGLDTSAVQDELVIAIYEVGQCFFQGWGVRKDLKMAVSYYTVAARLGDGDAQQDLGFCLANGRGCKKDRKEAAKWYRAAIAQGASDVGMAWVYKEKFQ